MLADIERKVLAILRNYSMAHQRRPTLHELEVRTGRSRQGVLEVLSSLEKERYIEWDPAAPKIILLEEWERPDIRPAGRVGYGEV